MVVGGRLRGSSGSVPGVLEETALSVGAGQSLFVAGGFGCAAAAVVRALEIDGMDWLPDGVSDGAEDWGPTLSEPAGTRAGSDQPGDIASPVALGISRL